MSRDQIAEFILLALADAEAEIAAQPEPPAWRYFEHRDWQEGREYGPKWSPSLLGPAGDTEARAVRARRVLYKLREAGLVVPCRTEGGRLWRCQLSETGRQAVAELRAARQAVAAGSASPE